MNDYGDANVAVRFGDNFQDLSRTNFEIALRGGMFFDHSEWPDYGDKARQTALGARAKIARGFGRSRDMNCGPGRNRSRAAASS